MCNIDPTLYGHIMLEREQAELAFERYKKLIKMIEEQSEEPRDSVSDSDSAQANGCVADRADL